MKLTAKERQAVAMLRSLDAQQRNELLAEISRVSLVNKIITSVGRRTGALTRVKTTPDHKIVKAFGTLPTLRRKKQREDD